MMETLLPPHLRRRRATAMAGAMRGDWPNALGAPHICFCIFIRLALMNKGIVLWTALSLTITSKEPGGSTLTELIDL